MNMTEGVEMLQLPGNRGMMIHPVLIWDDHTVILVDAGYPGQVQEIIMAMAKAGVAFSKLNKVIVTHQDYDHIGSLTDVVKASGQAVEVLAHQEEKPYIEGRQPWIKMELIRKMLESLPENQRKEAETKYQIPDKPKVDRTIADGEVLPYCGGITVIHTPGHTPGHICLYLNRSKTLISGDALNVVDGQLVGANPLYTADMARAQESVGKLARYEIEKVICYHGGVFAGNVKERLQELRSLPPLAGR